MMLSSKILMNTFYHVQYFHKIRLKRFWIIFMYQAYCIKIKAVKSKKKSIQNVTYKLWKSGKICSNSQFNGEKLYIVQKS